MVDRQWFMVYDAFFNFTEQYNAQGLYWNYFFHHWQVLSTSQFANAIAFTTETPEVTSVTLSPKIATASKGQNVQLTATVVATGMAPETVSWEVTGTETVTSTITSNGLLTIASDEANTTLTVTATSIFNTSKNDTATITVNP